MEGPAVVKDKTIYAVTDYCRSVMALTFESHETEGRLELYREYVVPHMGKREFSSWNSYHSTRHLVHLGENKFCLVRCCNIYGAHDHQYIQVTNIDLTKEIVTNICLHEFPTPRCFDQFIVKHCFSMPKRKTTTASKEGKRLPKSNTYPREDEAKVVKLPPELLRVHGKYSLRKKKQDFEQGGSVSQSGESKDHADTTPEVQEEVLKKPSASVVAAKSNVASKVSTISVVTDATKASTLGDGAASGRSNTVEEGDSIKTSGSSSSGRNNKVKNHGVDSQSKTTSGGHNVGKDSRSNQPRRSKGGRGRSRK